MRAFQTKLAVILITFLVSVTPTLAQTYRLDLATPLPPSAPLWSVPANAYPWKTCEEHKQAALSGEMPDKMAAYFLSGGKWMGVTCMRPDYVKSFQLFVKTRQFNPMRSVLGDLIGRANAGSPRAEADLQKLKSAGLIKFIQDGQVVLVRLNL